MAAAGRSGDEPSPVTRVSHVCPRGGPNAVSPSQRARLVVALGALNVCLVVTILTIGALSGFFRST